MHVLVKCCTEINDKIINLGFNICTHAAYVSTLLVKPRRHSKSRCMIYMRILCRENKKQKLNK